MKKVLMVAYFFPPLGGVGVQRTLKFAKYLPAFDWEPIILTVSNSSYQKRDEKLINEITGPITIVRSRSFELDQLFALLRKIVTRPSASLPTGGTAADNRESRLPVRLGISGRLKAWVWPDPWIGWMPSAVAAGSKAIVKYRPQAIYSTSLPYTGHLVAAKLKRRHKLPWIADLRDPWTLNPDFAERPAWRQRLESRLEKRVFRQADKIVLNTEPATEAYRRRYPEQAHKMLTITNGFDSSDFTLMPQESQNKKFTIIFSGSMYGTITPRPLLEAFAEFIALGGTFKKDVKLIFAGHVHEDVKGDVERCKLADMVDYQPFVSHTENIARLRTADALLLLNHAASGSELHVPAKTYEYLAIGKPILAVIQSGSASKIIEDTGGGIVVSPDDNSGIKSALSRMHAAWKAGRPMPGARKELIGNYDRYNLTGTLASVLNEVTTKGSADAGNRAHKASIQTKG